MTQLVDNVSADELDASDETAPRKIKTHGGPSDKGVHGTILFAREPGGVFRATTFYATFYPVDSAPATS